MTSRSTALASAILIVIGLAPTAVQADEGDALLAIPRSMVRLAIPDLAFADAPMVRGSLVLNAPAAHQEMCAWALAAYGATLDHVEPSCQTAGMLGVFEADFLRKVIHPLLIAATVLDGRLPGAGPAGGGAPAEPSEPLTLEDPTSGLRFRPSFMGFHGLTLRATLLFE